MILKDNGNDKLTVLKNPISLDSLLCVDSSTQETINIDECNKMSKQRKATIEIKTMTFLKEPISLDKIHFEGNSLTFNVKTIEWPVNKLPRKCKTDDKLQHWMRNAATIFELSYVYPFIYKHNRYKCFVCLETFVDANSLKQHTMSHDIKEIKQKLHNTAKDTIIKVDVTYLQCRVCGKLFHSLQELKGHLENHDKDFNSNAQDNLIPFRLACEPFPCQICGEEYHKLRPLIIHMSKHFNNCSCELCGAVFTTKISLNRHLQTHETGNFSCGRCDKIFSNSAKRTLHIRGVHLKRFPRRCPICLERFKSDYMRAKHLRLVHNRTAGLNKCLTCGKEYDLKYHLKLHMRSVHFQEKNQECPVCHVRFFSKYLLSRHMLIHTGIRNFKCEVCGKSYVRKAHLKQHSKSHFVD